ncbi:MAG: hypothetical protein PHW60_13905 [Kiritimatiellae bacterium]|nr:hypothetical protein [Kiritimatiellia bacterium]
MALKTEQRRFNDVRDILPVYVILLTPDYHVPFASRFFLERFGEARGRRCSEYLFGRTEPCEVCKTCNVLKTNAPHEWEWNGPDGTRLILEMGIDITERRQTEERLMTNEGRLSEAQRIAHIGNWDWNVVTGELSWSDEIYRVFGLQPQAKATDIRRKNHGD